MSRQISWQDRQRAKGHCIHHAGVPAAVLAISQGGVQVESKLSAVCYPCLLYARDYHSTVYPLKARAE